MFTPINSISVRYLMEAFQAVFDDRGVETASSASLKASEYSIKYSINPDLNLAQEAHVKYLMDFLNSSSQAGMAGESFYMWNPVYVLFYLKITGYDTAEIERRCISFFDHRRCSDGGFSGFSEDKTHLVSLYATINGIACIGTEEAFKLIDRESIYRILLSLKNEDGSFRVNQGGETDIRSTYSAIFAAWMLGILTPELTRGVAEYTLSLQAYDGGFSPIMEQESHGGYLHCAIGVLYILGRLDDADLQGVIRWIANKQTVYSGGFAGRANKLPDSCYNWWIGVPARIIAEHLKIPPFWNDTMITQYTIQSSQYLSGGFCDRRPSRPDYFHTLFGFGGFCRCGDTSLIDREIREMDTLALAPKECAQAMREYFINCSIYLKKFLAYSSGGAVMFLAFASNPGHSLTLVWAISSLGLFVSGLLQRSIVFALSIVSSEHHVSHQSHS